MKYILLGISFLIIQEVFAQHDVNAHFVRNSNEIAVYVNPESIMYIGDIQDTRIRMDKLSSNQDGEINVDLTHYDDSAIFRICLLVNDNKRYCFRIAPSGAYVELEGEKVAGSDFSFQQGDNFRVERCGNNILYFHNNRLVFANQLADASDVLFGVVQSEANADDLRVRIQFSPDGSS